LLGLTIVSIILLSLVPLLFAFVVIVTFKSHVKKSRVSQVGQVPRRRPSRKKVIICFYYFRLIIIFNETLSFSTLPGEKTSLLNESDTFRSEQLLHLRK
jgi:hypothetical protein